MVTRLIKLMTLLTAGALGILLYAGEEPDPNVEGAGADWDHYLAHPTSNQYSRLDQINRDNVKDLEIAWTYETGDKGLYQANNLVVNGIVYTVSPGGRVFALDGANGEARWSFDPSKVHGGRSDFAQRRPQRIVQRGLMFWQNASRKRIFMARGSYLYGLDATTGELDPSFGQEGWVDLGENFDVEHASNVFLNTPGQIYRETIIVGANTAENVPGSVRAFDVVTGERKWIFHTLPRPGEFGSDTWPEDYLERTGGASDWSGLALDPGRGIVFLSTETAGPDFYGADRFGENLFANSVVALDAATGERLWHQQLVHHDLWDLDLAQPPTLLTVMHEGQKRDIVAQGTKTGLLFAFDRVSGEPLWPIEEREVPESRIPGLETWPTQPFPSKPPPLVRQRYTEEDFSDISSNAALMTREVLRKSGNFGPYPPPSLEQIIMFPGFDGGMNWGGAAADPDGNLYVNVNEVPFFYQLIPTRRTDGTFLESGEFLYRAHCASCHGLDRSGSSSGDFPGLRDLSLRLPRDGIMNFIVGGAGRMPSFERLSERDRDLIVDFLLDVETPWFRHMVMGNAPPYVFRGFQRWLDDEGYPAVKPPWGTLNAVDMNTGTIKWKVPLGEFEELTRRGIPITGTENYGGPVVTAGGLVFIGATADGKFRVFDKENGALLRQLELPFDGNATPSTYLAGGKQFVVISCGGAKTKQTHGGTLVAFSLPD